MITKNVLITNVSTIPNAFPSVKKYVDDEKNVIEGKVTNEAPMKSIIKRLANKGENVDRIFLIESDTVRNSKKIIKGKILQHMII